MEKAHVAVVILNWNGLSHLQKFLPSVVEHSSGEAEIIVADNGSTDHSVAWVNKTYPTIKTIKNVENSGYAGGYNWALKEIEADYYVLLNSDVEVTPNWISPIINLMEEDPSIGACQPKILKYGNTSYFEYAGAGGGFIDKFGYPFCRGRIFQSFEADHGQYDDITEIFWATGACLFVRATHFHQLGGFDADFFAHMEEIDLCWRMKNSGLRVLYCGYAAVHHLGGGTLDAKNPKKTYLNMRNNLIMIYKNLPANRLVQVLVLRLMFDGFAAFKFLIDGGFRNFFAVTRAYLSFLKTLSNTKSKRTKILKSDTPNIYWGSIAIDYFIRRKQFFKQLNSQKFV